MTEIRIDPKDELLDLRELYLDTLSEKVRVIEVCSAEIRDAGPSAELLADLMHLTHRLAGSSAIYGFDEVSRSAARLEAAVLVGLEQEPGPGALLANELERLVETLRKAADGVRPVARSDVEEDR